MSATRPDFDPFAPVTRRCRRCHNSLTADHYSIALAGRTRRFAQSDQLTCNQCTIDNKQPPALARGYVYTSAPPPGPGAPCARENPELFFPATPAAEQAAAWEPICNRCPLAAACLTYGAENKHSGVWGGVNLIHGAPADTWRGVQRRRGARKGGAALEHQENA